jgi:hypothetical protein
MALTRGFKTKVAARVQRDPAFAQALLDEAISLFVNGGPESANLYRAEVGPFPSAIIAALGTLCNDSGRNVVSTMHNATKKIRLDD